MYQIGLCRVIILPCLFPCGGPSWGEYLLIAKVGLGKPVAVKKQPLACQPSALLDGRSSGARRQYVQSPDRLYKAPTDYTKPEEDYTKPKNDYTKI